jgi:hypothetical protein
MDNYKITDFEEPVTVKIKITKGQAMDLMGAANLGVILESWCSYLDYAYTGQADLSSARYMFSVDDAIKKIKRQTKIKKEYRNCASGDSNLNIIFNLLKDYCEKNKANWQKELYGQDK